jgi:hypothetical protein
MVAIYAIKIKKIFYDYIYLIIYINKRQWTPGRSLSTP